MDNWSLENPFAIMVTQLKMHLTWKTWWFLCLSKLCTGSVFVFNMYEYKLRFKWNSKRNTKHDTVAVWTVTCSLEKYPCTCSMALMRWSVRTHWKQDEELHWHLSNTDHLGLYTPYLFYLIQDDIKWFLIHVCWLKQTLSLWTWTQLLYLLVNSLFIIQQIRLR